MIIKTLQSILASEDIDIEANDIIDAMNETLSATGAAIVIADQIKRIKKASDIHMIARSLDSYSVDVLKKILEEV